MFDMRSVDIDDIQMDEMGLVGANVLLPKAGIDKDIDLEMTQISDGFQDESKVSERTQDEEEESIHDTVPRTIDLFGGVSLVVGLMIGSGIFASPGSILIEVKSIAVSLVVWVLGGLLAMAGALCYVELGTSISKGGGEFAYLGAAFGPMTSFLFTWTAALIARPASNSIIAIVCAEYIGKVVYVSDKQDEDSETDPPVLLVKVIAFALIAAVCLLQCVDSKLAMTVQKSTTVAKLAAIMLISVSGLWVLLTNSERRGIVFSKADWADADLSSAALSKAVVASLWAYDGWNNLNYALEEFQNPARNLPLAIIIAIPLVTLCYLCVNVAYYAVLNVSDIMGSETVGVAFGTNLVNSSWGGTLVCLFVAVSAFGALNGSMIGGSRLTHVAARDGIAPKFLYGLHPTRNTPHKAVIAQSVLSSLYILPGDFEQLLAFFSFGMWIFYSLTVISVAVLRYKNPECVRPFKVWTPLVFVFSAMASFLVINLLMSRTKACLACVAFLLLGMFVYGCKKREAVKELIVGFLAVRSFKVYQPVGDDDDDVVLNSTGTEIS
eukprot:CFRG2134T1